MEQSTDNTPNPPLSSGDKELQSLYDEMRRNFTAADLQKYTEIEEGVPLKQVIEEMEEIQRKSQEQQA